MNLFSDNLYQNTFSSFAVELAVEDLFPRPEVELTLRDCHYHLTAHNLTFKVSIGIIFKTIVTVLAVRFLGSQLLKPDLHVVMQAAFVVVDENAGCNVHRIDQYQSLPDAAFAQAKLYLRSDVDKLPTLRRLKPKLFPYDFMLERCD